MHVAGNLKLYSFKLLNVAFLNCVSTTKDVNKNCNLVSDYFTLNTNRIDALLGC